MEVAASVDLEACLDDTMASVLVALTSLAGVFAMTNAVEEDDDAFCDGAVGAGIIANGAVGVAGIIANGTSSRSPLSSRDGDDDNVDDDDACCCCCWSSRDHAPTACGLLGMDGARPSEASGGGALQFCHQSGRPPSWALTEPSTGVMTVLRSASFLNSEYSFLPPLMAALIAMTTMSYKECEDERERAREKERGVRYR